MDDSTLKFIEDLARRTKDKRIKKVLKIVSENAPDFGYMDWNDRQDFYENEYDDLLSETIKELEGIYEICEVKERR